MGIEPAIFLSPMGRSNHSATPRTQMTKRTMSAGSVVPTCDIRSGKSTNLDMSVYLVLHKCFIKESNLN